MPISIKPTPYQNPKKMLEKMLSKNKSPSKTVTLLIGPARDNKLSNRSISVSFVNQNAHLLLFLPAQIVSIPAPNKYKLTLTRFLIVSDLYL